MKNYFAVFFILFFPLKNFAQDKSQSHLSLKKEKDVLNKIILPLGLKSRFAIHTGKKDNFIKIPHLRLQIRNTELSERLWILEGLLMALKKRHIPLYYYDTNSNSNSNSNSNTNQIINAVRFESDGPVFSINPNLEFPVENIQEITKPEIQQLAIDKFLQTLMAQLNYFIEHVVKAGSRFQRQKNGLVLKLADNSLNGITYAELFQEIEQLELGLKLKSENNKILIELENSSPFDSIDPYIREPALKPNIKQTLLYDIQLGALKDSKDAIFYIEKMANGESLFHYQFQKKGKKFDFKRRAVFLEERPFIISQSQRRPVPIFGFFQGQMKPNLIPSNIHLYDHSQHKVTAAPMKKSDLTYLAKRPRITKEECEQLAFDNRQRMGADTQQKNSPLCWDHAVSALMEETLYLYNENFRNKIDSGEQENISRLELWLKLGLYKNINEKSPWELSGNSNVKNSLEYFINPQGGNYQICLEKYSPNIFNNWDYVEVVQTFKEAKEFFTEVKTRALNKHPGATCQQGPKEIPANLKKIIKSYQKMQADTKKYWTQALPSMDSAELRSEFFNAKQVFSQFLDNFFLSDCEQTRKSFLPKDHKLKVKSHRWQKAAAIKKVNTVLDQDLGPAKNFLAELKQEGVSAVLSLCYHTLLYNMGVQTTSWEKAQKCGRHAVVFNAVKWDPKLKVCNGWIKNSHGDNAKLKSGLYPLDLILSHTYEATHYAKDYSLAR